MGRPLIAALALALALLAPGLAGALNHARIRPPELEPAERMIGPVALQITLARPAHRGGDHPRLVGTEYWADPELESIELRGADLPELLAESFARAGRAAGLWIEVEPPGPTRGELAVRVEEFWCAGPGEAPMSCRAAIALTLSADGAEPLTDRAEVEMADRFTFRSPNVREDYEALLGSLVEALVGRLHELPPELLAALDQPAPGQQRGVLRLLARPDRAGLVPVLSTDSERFCVLEDGAIRWLPRPPPSSRSGGGPALWAEVDGAPLAGRRIGGPGAPRLIRSVDGARALPADGLQGTFLPRPHLFAALCAEPARFQPVRPGRGLVHPEYIWLIGADGQVLGADDFVHRGAGWQRPLRAVRERDGHQLTLAELAPMLGAEHVIDQRDRRLVGIDRRIDLGPKQASIGGAMMAIGTAFLVTGFITSGMWIIDGGCGSPYADENCSTPASVHAGRAMFVGGLATIGAGTPLMIVGFASRDAARARQREYARPTLHELARPPEVWAVIDRHNRRLSQRKRKATAEPERSP